MFLKKVTRAEFEVVIGDIFHKIRKLESHKLDKNSKNAAGCGVSAHTWSHADPVFENLRRIRELEAREYNMQVEINRLNDELREQNCYLHRADGELSKEARINVYTKLPAEEELSRIVDFRKEEFRVKTS